MDPSLAPGLCGDNATHQAVSSVSNLLNEGQTAQTPILVQQVNKAAHNSSPIGNDGYNLWFQDLPGDIQQRKKKLHTTHTCFCICLVWIANRPVRICIVQFSKNLPNRAAGGPDFAALEVAAPNKRAIAARSKNFALVLRSPSDVPRIAGISAQGAVAGSPLLRIQRGFGSSWAQSIVTHAEILRQPHQSWMVRGEGLGRTR